MFRYVFKPSSGISIHLTKGDIIRMKGAAYANLAIAMTSTEYDAVLCYFLYYDTSYELNNIMCLGFVDQCIFTHSNESTN
jgi:hypothetical protein